MLIVQPGDSFFPLVDAIDNATQTINMTIFRMDDPVVRDALSHAVERGVRVKALVAPSSKGWTRRNKELTYDLSKLGVEVKSPKPGKEKYKRYHYKMMIVDDRLSLVLTFNPTQKNMHYARDFGLLIRDPKIAIELNRLFDADWMGKTFTPANLPLVISPHNSRAKLLDLIDSADRTIRIMDAKLRDKDIINLLMQKSAAGCDVKIISRRISLNGAAANLQVKRLSRYKLHAKTIVIDGNRFFIGSQNLRKANLDSRREAGIMVEDPALGLKINRIFDEDWEDSNSVSVAQKSKG